MTDYIDDNLALPDVKSDENTVTDPDRQWAADDANRVFDGLRSVQSKLYRTTFNVRTYGALVDGTTDDAVALIAAIAAAAVTVSAGFGARVMIPKGTLISSQTIEIPNGVMLCGAPGVAPASYIKASPTFNSTALVTNANRTGTQEYAFLQDLIIDGNKGSGAVCSVAVVDWVSLFVNSYIRDCIIQEGSNVGLRVAADGTPGGMGPILIDNCWVARNTGHNVLVEDTVANTGAATGIVFVTLTSENQGTNKSAIYLKGNGRLSGLAFIGTTHIEMGNAAFTGRTGITCDGVSHTRFDNVQLLSAPASISEGINILNVAQNVGLKFEHIYNPNIIATVVRDQKNGLTLGGINVNSYVTADWTNYGAPQFAPVTGKKSLVALNAALTPKFWFDDAGQATGDSANGAGLDVVSSEGVTNDRALTLVNFAKNRVYGWAFPPGGGGVLRMRYITGGVDIMQIGTDGTIFVYETTTFQKGVRYIGEIAPTSIGANQNDYAPTSFANAATLMLTSSGAFNITGFAAPSTGRTIWVYNNGANNITLKHQDAGSTALNRIIGRSNADVVLTPATGVQIQYSPSVTRWLILGDTL